MAQRKEAGVVGIGRVVAEPQLRAMDPAERRFVLTPDEGSDEATRALVRFRSVPFVSKDRVRQVSAMHEHQIVRAPMGTVFAVGEQEWEALRPLLPPPPDAADEPTESLPPAFAWPQRAKGVLPMPGGYDGYLKSLEKVCAIVEEERPAPHELAERLAAELGVKATAARLRESFLRKVGITIVHGGVCRLGPWTERWRTTGDDRIVTALLHGRCQFVGELLSVAVEPHSTEELLTVANERFAMGWDTQTQIDNRRGWLQSAGMLASTDDRKLRTTEAGQALIRELDLFDPTGPVPPVQPAEAPTPPVVVGTDPLVEELRASSIDSGHPDRFEQAVRDAFAFLGFDAEWLGGSGKTDVILDAPLGKDDSYRVIIDCKTSASGSVSDQQVDWATLAEHKAKHDADYVGLVAPKPSGARLVERGQHFNVTVVSAEQLGGLCRQHAKTPLGLDDYRTLFGAGGVVDTQATDERSEEVRRLATLSAAACDAMRERSVTFGRLSARDLFLILAGDPTGETTTEEELQTLLDALANPLVGLLDGSPQAGYRVTTSPEVFRMRLDALALALGTPAASGKVEA